MTTQETNRKTGEQDESVRVVLEAAAIGDGGASRAAAPQRVLLVPWGEVESDAGSFVMDADAAAATLAAYEGHGTELPIDYEHQTLGGAYSSPTGQAPAAGWIAGLLTVSPEMAGRDGMPDEPGLWANVTWTGDGAERLANRQYRYLSPVALVRKSDRRLIGLHSAALTNKPAIVGMKPVVNRSEPPGATESDLLEADLLATHLAALRLVLSLDGTAEEALVLRTAVGRLRELQVAEENRRAQERVASATAAGKLTPAQRDWAFALALRDPSEFDRWEAGAPRVVMTGRVAAPPQGASDGSATQRAVESAARAEWRANKAFLEQLCSEDAYVAGAARGTGRRTQSEPDARSEGGLVICDLRFEISDSGNEIRHERRKSWL